MIRNRESSDSTIQYTQNSTDLIATVNLLLKKCSLDQKTGDQKTGRILPRQFKKGFSGISLESTMDRSERKP